MEKVFIVEYDNGESYNVDHYHHVVAVFSKEEDAQKFIDDFNKLDTQVSNAMYQAWENKMPQDEYRKIFSSYYEKYYKAYDLSIGSVQNSLIYYEKVVN